jgi:hypothetical protein
MFIGRVEAVLICGLIVLLIYTASVGTQRVWLAFLGSLVLALLWFWLNTFRDGIGAARKIGIGLFLFGLSSLLFLGDGPTRIPDLVLLPVFLGFGAYFCFSEKRKPNQVPTIEGVPITPSQPNTKTQAFGLPSAKWRELIAMGG